MVHSCKNTSIQILSQQTCFSFRHSVHNPAFTFSWCVFLHLIRVIEFSQLWRVLTCFTTLLLRAYLCLIAQKVSEGEISRQIKLEAVYTFAQAQHKCPLCKSSRKVNVSLFKPHAVFLIFCLCSISPVLHAVTPGVLFSARLMQFSSCLHTFNREKI